MPDRLSEAELDEILQREVTAFDLGRNIAMARNITGNEGSKIAHQAIDRLNALIGAAQLTREVVEKAVSAERSEVFCHRHNAHWDNHGVCPVCEAEDTRKAIAAMTEGSEEEVAALLAMVADLIDNPYARVLLRHVGAQGERLQRAHVGLERLRRAESLLATALDLMEHGFVWRNAKEAADAMCLAIKAFLDEKKTPSPSLPEPSSSPESVSSGASSSGSEN